MVRATRLPFGGGSAARSAARRRNDAAGGAPGGATRLERAACTEGTSRHPARRPPRLVWRGPRDPTTRAPLRRGNANARLIASPASRST